MNRQHILYHQLSRVAFLTVYVMLDVEAHDIIAFEEKAAAPSSQPAE